MWQMPEYDMALDTEDVALRALYRLYRRGKWSLLEEVGIIRATHQAALDAACEDMGYRLVEADVARLRRDCPALLGAAAHLRDRYRFVTLFSYLAFQEENGA